MPLTCKRALDQDLIGKIAAATGLGRRAVGSRLRKAAGQTQVRTVLAEAWPQDAAALGPLPAGTILALELVPEVAKIVGLSDARVAKVLASWHPNKWTQNVFADRWPAPESDEVESTEDGEDEEDEDEDDLPVNIDEGAGGDWLRRGVATRTSTQHSRVVNSRYEVRRLLGKGGFGRAELAWDRNTKADVVLKYSHETRVDQLEREMKRVRDLRHDHICICWDIAADQATGEAFLVFEYGGDSLTQMIEQGALRELDEVLAVTGQVAGALDYAHEKGIFHNDVSPSNVLVMPRPNRRALLHARLTDFGIASVAKPATHTMVAGHPGYGHPIYASPELNRLAEKITRRADQYSLALVFCTLLEHEVFEERYVLRKFSRLSSRQNAALRRALHSDEAQRFPSCTAFFKELVAGI